MNVAIVGVTGVVGETLLTILEERRVDVARLGPFARTARDGVRFNGREWPVLAADWREIASGRFDVVFCASAEETSTEMVQRATAGGTVVIDNSPAFRMRDDVPLIVPEINAHLVDAGTRIYPVANCTAILLSVALAPIVRESGVRTVRVATYQAVSGAGRAGLLALEREERGTSGDSPFAAPVHRNVVPAIGPFDAAGRSSEELKVAAETRKILGLPELRVAATTVRVPVTRAHSLAAFIETKRPTTVSSLAAALEARHGLVFHRDGIVTARDVEGDDRVHVARLRADDESGRNFQLWIVGDQLRRGAATTAVEILQLLLARGYVSRVAAAAT